MKRYFVFLLCGLLLSPAVLVAKEDTDSLSLGQPFANTGIRSVGLSTQTVKKPKKTWFKALRFSGQARFYPYYRNLKSYYDIPPTNGLTVPVNITADDGYLQPLMLLRMEANPSAKTWFQTELQFNHYMLRNNIANLADTAGRLANLYVIFQFKAGVDTRFGKIQLTAGGGVNWYRLSPFTLWQYQFRDDMFERYPWEPEGHDFARYNSFYSVGDIPRDQRFGMQATQGFILEGTNMPGGFDAAVLFGKTNTSGGFQSYLSKSPQNMFGGRIGKALGDHKVGMNYFNQFGYTSSKVDYKPVFVDGADTFYVKDNYTSQIVTTGDVRLNFDKFNIFSEFGVGSYLSNTYNSGLKENAKSGVDHASFYKRDWDETMFLEVTTKRQLTFIPLKLQLYRIGALIVNNSSSVYNTTVEQAKPSPDTPDNYFINYYDGMVMDIGQMANNRQGVNLFLNKDFFYNKIKTRLAFSMAQEINNLAGDTRNGARSGSNDSLVQVPYTNSITFQHRLNSLTRSRFGFYQRFTGPYNRLHSIFRRTYENIAITDTEIDYKKSFSNLDFEVKYKFKFLGKELIVSNYVNFSSVQDFWSPVPVFADKAFLRTFYEELMAFYAIHQKVTLVGFFGTETVKGNSRTELADANGNPILDSGGRPIADANGKPVDQIGYGYGLGFDYNFHSRASLHLRNRWFSHKDKNFILDRFKGNEMTMEFKVFF